MFEQISERQFRLKTTRRVRNQYMSRARRVAIRRDAHSGLHPKTWASIAIITLLFAIIETPVITFGKSQQIATDSLHISKAWAMTFPKAPELAPVKERTEVIALIKKIWGKDAQTGLEIAKCESGYRVNALNQNTNGTVDEGVFQVNSVHGMPDMMNPTANISYAYTKFLEQGTNPWVSSKKCWEGNL